LEEVTGVAPYEARLMDLIDLSEKRAQRFAKKRLGSIRRAKRKLKDIEAVKRRIRKREQELLEAKKH
jgi:large subunit ribosomal protein L36e